ncbi:MAG: hypothetical protein MJ246_02595 [Clostridia bacterium]|nr:hypothetical protein [Clostridia bacterium]
MKKLGLIILTLALGFTITGCNNSNVEVPEEEHEGTFEELITIKNGETKTLDINGDGKEENVSYTINKFADDEYYGNATITVDDATYETEGCSPVDTLTIAKTNTKDKDYKILVGDEGPSCDFTTEFLSYDGKNINSLGTVGGILDLPLYDFNDGLVLNHDGTISTPERADIVQTWWYTANYEIGDKVKLIKQDFYPVECQTKLLMDYDFYTKPNVKSDKVSLEEGQELEFTEIDNVE